MTLKQFRMWLRERIDGLDQLPDCSDIVRDTITHAARLGLADLVEQGQQLSRTCGPGEAMVFLAKCVGTLESTTKPPKSTYNLREAADELGLSIDWLRELVARREIDFIQAKKWGRIQFTRQMLDAYRDRRTNLSKYAAASPVKISRPKLEAWACGLDPSLVSVA